MARMTTPPGAPGPFIQRKGSGRVRFLHNSMTNAVLVKRVLHNNIDYTLRLEPVLWPIAGLIDCAACIGTDISSAANLPNDSANADNSTAVTAGCEGAANTMFESCAARHGVAIRELLSCADFRRHVSRRIATYPSRENEGNDELVCNNSATFP